MTLIVRLLVLQGAVGFVTAVLLFAFAPRLLLLDEPTVAASESVLVGASFVHLAFVAVGTVIAVRGVRAALAMLASGNEPEPHGLLALYALPARLAVSFLIVLALVSGATLLPGIRPSTNDVQTQAALVLLAITVVSASTLPLYVRMRRTVGRELERVPPDSARGALAAVELSRRSPSRLRLRLLAAVAAPVAFVALGASLLVHAHARAQEGLARETDARKLARAVLDTAGTAGDLGRKEAAAAAGQWGYAVEFDATPVDAETVEVTDGLTAMTLPLAGGGVRIRFQSTRISPVIGVYVLLALLATALAALLGQRIGAAYSDDLGLATREVRNTGVLDILRGTRIQRDARFSSIATLMGAIDELGGVFREFASAQERAIEARAATERMRALFLASMSHDLKSPLNSILGFTELVRRSELTGAQRESLAIIEQRGRELLLLVRTILDSARVEAGELDMAPEWTSIADILAGAVLDTRELLAADAVRIATDLAPGLPRVWADPIRLIQALTEIIASAVRFSERGTVYVRATIVHEVPELLIEVETAGRAIPNVELEKIFDAFKDAERARRHGSLGLGLSLARSIILLHGGSIGIESQGLAGGNAFRVRLPHPVSA